MAWNDWKWVKLTGNTWKGFPNGGGTTVSHGLVLSDFYFIRKKILRVDSLIKGKNNEYWGIDRQLDILHCSLCVHLSYTAHKFPMFAWSPDLPGQDWSVWEVCLICLSSIDQAVKGSLIRMNRIGQAGRLAWFAWEGLIRLGRDAWFAWTGLIRLGIIAWFAWQEMIWQIRPTFPAWSLFSEVPNGSKRFKR